MIRCRSIIKRAKIQGVLKNSCSTISTSAFYINFVNYLRITRKKKGLGMKCINLVILFLSLGNLVLADEHTTSLLTNISTQKVGYQIEDVNFTGYLAYDASINTKRPGVLVVHEWWGHNEYARKRAYQLAELGYIALAVDMYGDGKLAEHPSDASKFMKEVTNNMPLAEKRLQTALDVLNNHELTDTDKTAAIGYCFGGGMVLHLARIGTDIDGVVSFHGSLTTQSPAKLDTVKARVLVLHGADDPFIPREQVDAFKEEMQNAGVQYEFVAYPNVKHSFTNPQADEFSKNFDLPALQYNQHADEDSWNRMKVFLNDVFK